MSESAAAKVHFSCEFALEVQEINSYVPCYENRPKVPAVQIYASSGLSQVLPRVPARGSAFRNESVAAACCRSATTSGAWERNSGDTQNDHLDRRFLSTLGVRHLACRSSMTSAEGTADKQRIGHGVSERTGGISLTTANYMILPLKSMEPGS